MRQGIKGGQRRQCKRCAGNVNARFRFGSYLADVLARLLHFPLTDIISGRKLRQMPQLRFREDKVTQAAARLLKCHGREMPYLKLIKLLYFADRLALLKLGRPISYDSWVSMPWGPVLSRTKDLITEEPNPRAPKSYWRRYISAPANYSVTLLCDAPNDQLSPAEEGLLDKVFRKYGNTDQWDLVKVSHRFKEYHDPRGSSLPISAGDILVAQGISPRDARIIERELAASASADDLTE